MQCTPVVRLCKSGKILHSCKLNGSASGAIVPAVRQPNHILSTRQVHWNFVHVVDLRGEGFRQRSAPPTIIGSFCTIADLISMLAVHECDRTTLEFILYCTSLLTLLLWPRELVNQHGRAADFEARAESGVLLLLVDCARINFFGFSVGIELAGHCLSGEDWSHRNGKQFGILVVEVR